MSFKMTSIEIIAINNVLISVYQKCLKQGLTPQKARRLAIDMCSDIMANDEEMAYKVMLAFTTTDEAFEIYSSKVSRAAYKQFVRQMKKDCRLIALSFTMSKKVIFDFLRPLKLDLNRSILEKRIMDELMFLEAKPVPAIIG